MTESPLCLLTLEARSSDTSDAATKRTATMGSVLCPGRAASGCEVKHALAESRPSSASMGIQGARAQRIDADDAIQVWLNDRLKVAVESRAWGDRMDGPRAAAGHGVRRERRGAYEGERCTRGTCNGWTKGSWSGMVYTRKRLFLGVPGSSQCAATFLTG